MLNGLSPARKRLFGLINILILISLWSYTFLEKNYFPENTECSLNNRLFKEQCIFAIRTDFLDIAYFTADGESIVYAVENILKIEPIGLLKSFRSNREIVHPDMIRAFTLSQSRNKIGVCTQELGATQFALWVWDAQNGTLLKRIQLEAFNGCPYMMEFSPDEDTLGFSTGGPPVINLVNWRTGVLQSLAGEKINFSPSGDLIAIYDEKTIKFLSYPALDMIRTIENIDYVKDITFSPDGSLIASTGFSEILLWDVKKGVQVDKWEQLDMQRCNLKFLTPDTLVTCLNVGGEVFITNWYFSGMGTREQSVFYFSVMKVGSRDVSFIDVSPDKTKILVSYDHHIGVFDYPEMYR